VKEVPHLVQLQKDFSAKGFSVLGLMQGNALQARSFAQQRHTNYPIKTGSGQDFSNFNVWFVPANYLVDPKGQIVADNLDDARAILSSQLR
jgi:peroxiredoxin